MMMIYLYNIPNLQIRQQDASLFASIVFVIQICNDKQKNILFQELVRFWVAFNIDRWRQREYRYF